jgi:hypothetical protein
MKTRLPLRLPTDDPEMREAVIALENLGIRPLRTSMFQLKVGPLNFWPGRGTITQDHHPPISEKGLDAFLSRLPKRRATLNLSDLGMAPPIPRQ